MFPRIFVCLTLATPALSWTSSHGHLRLTGGAARPLPADATVRAERSRQLMHNNGDVSYTISMVVGNQTIEAVPDTGSFDLLVFSSLCKFGCGNPKFLYNRTQSLNFEHGQNYQEHSFGSGKTMSYEAYDTVRAGNLWSKRQLFWEVYSADMPILIDLNFQAILGLGPPSSSIEIAVQDAREVKHELDSLPGATSLSAGQTRLATHYYEIADLAKKARSVAASFQLQSFSICLGRSVGSPGVIVWHDLQPEERPVNVFKTVPLKGGLFWSAQLENVALGALPSGQDDSKTSLGCSDVACTAVLDSGTSLIVAPQQAVAQVNEALTKWRALSGNCTDLSTLPHLEFEMGGSLFRLPPESYVGDLSGDVSKLDPDVRRFLLHLQSPNQTRLSALQGGRDHHSVFDACTPMLMVMDQDPSRPPQWILGMPFFREYYSTFSLGQAKLPWRRQAMSMSFAKAGPDCYPADSDVQMPDEALRQTRRMRIDISKLRVPRWALQEAKQKARHL
eukprot:CAMPEP_0170618794 /NCGR_PEP_ID=MMETSP0224-20130122/27153_1 /TAXON_ID=285029 /ORGANISM="Togula jolla, Strain CCCM 725" /LENGTH=504 /DNA_ID=CAMNT_0010944801 /DNA_START=66 /DNA_END=1580 /DNA_ORIENTATION=-